MGSCTTADIDCETLLPEQKPRGYLDLRYREVAKIGMSDSDSEPTNCPVRKFAAVYTTRLRATTF